MLIKRTSIVSGKTYVRDLPVTAYQLEQYYSGVPVQEAFPNLSEQQILFIESGIPKEEQNLVTS